MRLKPLLGLCILILLATSVTAIKTTGTVKEDSTVSRLVGETPYDIINQLDQKQLNLKHATHLSSRIPIVDDNVDNRMITNGFGNNANSKRDFKEFWDNPSPFWWGYDRIEEELTIFKKNELFVLESAIDINDFSLHSLLKSDNIYPEDTRAWKPTFAKTNPLLVLNIESSGLALPNEPSFVNELTRYSTIIAPNDVRSAQFIQAFLCNLDTDRQVGEAYRYSRSRFYTSSKPTNQNMPGIVLKSYSLYGNPLARLTVPEDYSVYIKDFDFSIKKPWQVGKLTHPCKNFYVNPQDFEALSTASLQDLSLNEEIEIQYNLAKHEDYTLINATNTLEDLDNNNLVGLYTLQKHKLPKGSFVDSINYSFTLNNNFVIADYPSFIDGNYTERNCYDSVEDQIMSSEVFERENHDEVLVYINPLAINNCATGNLTLATKMNYKIPYIPSAPFFFDNATFTPILAPGESTKVDLDFIYVSAETPSGTIRLHHKNNTLYNSPISTNEKHRQIEFNSLDEETTTEYTVEYIFKGTPITEYNFQQVTRILEGEIGIGEVTDTATVTLELESYKTLPVKIEAELLERGIVYTKELTLDMGDNTITFDVLDLEKAKQSYGIVIYVTYENTRKTFSDLIVTNNPPIIHIEKTIFTTGEKISPNITATDTENDQITLTITGDKPTPWIENEAGAHKLIIKASDGIATSEKEIELTIINQNNKPELIEIPNIGIYEGDIASIITYADDPDDDNLTYSVNSPLYQQVDNNWFEWQTSATDAGIYTVTAKASDGQKEDSQEITVEVLPRNFPPQLDFIPDITTKVDEFVLIEAFAEDPDNDTITFHINDSRFTKNNNNFTWKATAGTFHISITASDGELNDTQDVEIEITQPGLTLKPIDDITLTEGETATVKVVAEYYEIQIAPPDNIETIYEINDTRFRGQTCGGFAGIKCPTDYTCKTPKNIPDATGECKLADNIFEWKTKTGDASHDSFRISATRANESTHKDFKINVEIKTNENKPPIIVMNATPRSGPVPLEVQFSATGSTDDTEIVLYEWDFGDSTNTTGENPKHTYNNSGTFIVQLQAVDNVGARSSKNITIIAESVKTNKPPVVEKIPDRTIRVGEKVTLTTIATDPDDDTLTYKINDTRFAQNNEIFTWTPEPSDTGNQTFIITVSDEEFSTPTEVTITIQKTNLNVVINATPQKGPVPLEVQFSSTGSTSDNEIVLYEWDFNDSTEGSGENPKHTFQNEGLYQVSVTATDKSGAKAKATIQVSAELNPNSDSIQFTVDSPIGDTTSPAKISTKVPNDAYSFIDLDDSIELYIPMTEGKPVIEPVDSTGKNYATLTGTVYSIDGAAFFKNSSLLFNNPGNIGIIKLSFKTEKEGTLLQMGTWENGQNIFIDSSGRVHWTSALPGRGRATIASTEGYNNNTWYEILIHFSGLVVDFYIGGQKIGSTPYNPFPTHDVIIGSGRTDYEGLLDDISFAPTNYPNQKTLDITFQRKLSTLEDWSSRTHLIQTNSSLVQGKFGTATASGIHELSLNPRFEFKNSTLSTWLQTTDPGTLISKGNFKIKVENDGFLSITGQETVKSSTKVNDNKWHHVAFTADNQQGRLYIDGIEEASVLLKTSEDQPLYIAYDIEGLIDDTLIFNRILEQSEIKALAGLAPASLSVSIPGKHTLKAYAVKNSGQNLSTETRNIEILQPNFPKLLPLPDLKIYTGETATIAPKIELTQNDFEKYSNDFLPNRSLSGKIKITAISNTETRKIHVTNSTILTLTQRTYTYASDDKYSGSTLLKIDGTNAIGIGYVNFNERYQCDARYGIYLFREEGGPHGCHNQRSAKVNPHFNEWINETLIYNIETGKVQYYLNGKNEVNFTAGDIPQKEDHTLTITYTSWGHETGQQRSYMEIDEMSLTSFDSRVITVEDPFQGIKGEYSWKTTEENIGIHNITIASKNNWGNDITSFKLSVEKSCEEDFCDNFTTGNNWNIEQGTWEFKETAKHTGNEGGFIKLNTNLSHGSYEFDLKLLDKETDFSIMLHGNGPGLRFNTSHQLELYPKESQDETDRIVEKIGDQTILLVQKNKTLEPNKWYHITIETNNSMMTTFIDGIKYMTTEATTIPGGVAVGFFKQGEIKNFKFNQVIEAPKIGVIIPSIIEVPSEVTQNTLFNVTYEYECQDGNCENVQAFLDPEEVQDYIVEYEPTQSFFTRAMRTYGYSRIEPKIIKSVESLTDAEAQNKLQQKNVKVVIPNLALRTQLTSASKIIGADTVHSNNLTGDSSICVIDTGVDYTHPLLGNCQRTDNINDGRCSLVIGGKDILDNDNDPFDSSDSGHGTHVAGIIASTKTENTGGIAPTANIVAVRTLTTEGGQSRGSINDLYNSVSWCIENAKKYKITAISMSLGASLFENNCDSYWSSFTELTQSANKDGIAVIAASGNDNSNTGMKFPACISNVISVGATTKDDTIASFSNRNKFTDILAPGVSIISTIPNNQTKSMSGTSMATPIVSSTFALARQQTEERQQVWNLQNTIQHFKVTGKPIKDSEFTYPRINVEKSILGKGIIPTTMGATPFYTISANPHNADCLKKTEAGQTCRQTWTVNATGSVDTTWEFFTIYKYNGEDILTNISELTIISPNRPPTITIEPLKATENLPFIYNIKASDPDNDTVSFVLTNAPTGMIMNKSALIWQSPEYGNFKIKITVTDGKLTTNAEFGLLVAKKLFVELPSTTIKNQTTVYITLPHNAIVHKATATISNALSVVEIPTTTVENQTTVYITLPHNSVVHTATAIISKVTQNIIDKFDGASNITAKDGDIVYLQIPKNANITGAQFFITPHNTKYGFLVDGVVVETVETENGQIVEILLSKEKKIKEITLQTYLRYKCNDYKNMNCPVAATCPMWYFTSECSPQYKSFTLPAQNIENIITITLPATSQVDGSFIIIGDFKQN